jgi:hypothetical protein|tara:strand:+ start:308 stop:1198 length:891 start_codon:yes stop_codon:yes gene_type:complete
MSKVKIAGHASGSGTLTIQAPDTSSSRTITLPDETATLSTFDPDGAVTINDTGADVDFRVESDDKTNALFVQGSDGSIGLGTGTVALTEAQQAGDFVTMLGTGTNGSILELAADKNTNDDSVGIVSFVNTANSNAAAGSRLYIAQVRGKVNTDDTNAGDDSGGNLVFQTKANGGAISDKLIITADGRGLSEFTAKAWVNWDQNGALNDSHNVASITDHATGTYSVVLDNDMSGTDYCLTACAQRLAPGLDSTVSVDVNASLRTNGCDIYVVRIKADGNANVKVDVAQNWALFFGAN